MSKLPVLLQTYVEF